MLHYAVQWNTIVEHMYSLTANMYWIVRVILGLTHVAENLHHKQPCAIPCERTMLESVLSTTSLPHHNTKYVLFHGVSDIDAKLETAAKNFHHSSEIKQRVTREICEYDKAHITYISDWLGEIVTLVDALFHAMESPRHLAATYGVKDILVDGQKVMSDQYSEWRQIIYYRHDDMVYHAKNPFSAHEINNLEDVEEELRYLLTTEESGWETPLAENYLGTVTILDALRDCLANNISIDSITKNLDEIDFYDILVSNSSILTNESYCVYLSQYKVAKYRERSRYDLKHIQNLNDSLEAALLQYVFAVKALFNDTGIRLQNFSEYQECLALVNISRRLLWLLSTLAEDAVALGRQSSTQEMLVYAEDLVKILVGDESTYAREVLRSRYTYDHPCLWLYKYSAICYSMVETNGEYLVKDSAFSVMESAILYHQHAARKYEQVVDHLHAIRLTLTKEIVPIAAAMESYRMGNITKLNLAAYLKRNDDVALQQVFDFSVMISDLSLLMHDLVSTLGDAKASYQSAFSTLWGLTLPVYSYTELWDSPLWKELLELSPDPALQAILRNITTERPWPVHFESFLESLFEPFLVYPIAQASVIDRINTKFFKVLTIYWEYLHEYYEGMQIDDEFYL